MTRETKVGLLLAFSFVLIFGLVIANKWRTSDDPEPSVQANQTKPKNANGAAINKKKPETSPKPATKPNGIVPVKFTTKGNKAKPPAKLNLGSFNPTIPVLPSPKNIPPVEIVPVPPLPTFGNPPIPPTPSKPRQITAEEQTKMEQLLAMAQKDSKKKKDFVPPPPPPPPIPDLPKIDETPPPLPMPVETNPKSKKPEKEKGSQGIPDAGKQKSNTNSIGLPSPENLVVPKPAVIPKTKNQLPKVVAPAPRIEPPGLPEINPPLPTPTPSPVKKTKTAPKVEKKEPPPIVSPPVVDKTKPKVTTIPKQPVEFKPANKKPIALTPPIEKPKNNPTISIRPMPPMNPAVIGNGNPNPRVAPMGSPAPIRIAPITIEPNPGAAPQTQVIDVESHSVAPGDNPATISQKYYNTDKYAQALLHFNREYPLGDQNLGANGARLQPGQIVYIPPPFVLDRYTGNSQSATPAAAKTKPMAIPAVSPKPLQPNAGAPITLNPTTKPGAPATGQWSETDKSKQYQVAAGGEWMFDIARKALGDGKRWNEVYRLNPQLRPEFRVPEGTMVRIPAAVK